MEALLCILSLSEVWVVEICKTPFPAVALSVLGVLTRSLPHELQTAGEDILIQTHPRPWLAFNGRFTQLVFLTFLYGHLILVLVSELLKHSR